MRAFPIQTDTVLCPRNSPFLFDLRTMLIRDGFSASVSLQSVGIGPRNNDFLFLADNKAVLLGRVVGADAVTVLLEGSWRLLSHDDDVVGLNFHGLSEVVLHVSRLMFAFSLLVSSFLRRVFLDPIY